MAFACCVNVWYGECAHERHVRRTLTLTLTLTHTITAYSVSWNVVRVRILICATRQKPCRKRVYPRRRQEQSDGRGGTKLPGSGVHGIGVARGCTTARASPGREQKLFGLNLEGVSCKCTPPPGRARSQIIWEIFCWERKVGVCEWFI